MNEPIGDTGVPDDDLLAAEYALGVLAGAERQTVERRIARERDFAARVTAWESRLAPWSEDIAPVQPPHEVWNRISAQLPQTRAGSSALPDWWSSASFWRWGTFGACGVAAACMVALMLVLKGPEPLPLMASIDGGGHHHFIATVDGKRGTVAVMPAAFSADATRVPELWLITPGEKPRSLGLLSADKTVTLVIPNNLRASAADQTVLAVSLEPPGGSKTGAPTGPVIAQGKLTTL